MPDVKQPLSEVYVVEEGEYEQRGIMGIYTTREGALEAARKDASVTVYGLDGNPEQCPSWWTVSFTRHGRTTRVTAEGYGDAGRKPFEPKLQSWPGRKDPDRLDIAVLAASKKEAIELAKATSDEESVTCSEYDPGVYSRWRKRGVVSLGSIRTRWRGRDA